MPYRKYESSLAPLESFDAQAFTGDGTCPQEVYNFVLALALTYNDFKDIFMAQGLLDHAAPEGEQGEVPSWGQYNALRAHATRLHAGLIHELCNLIRDADKVRDHDLFKKVVRNLRVEARKAWNALEDIALGNTFDNPEAKSLFFMRNKVAFHYDPKEIAKGYSSLFLGNSPKMPYISRGSSLGGSRFYFADAAAQEYTFFRAEDEAAKALLAGTSALLRQVHLALFEIVTKFIQARGFGWRPVPAST